jgi:hypothetical protein
MPRALPLLVMRAIAVGVAFAMLAGCSEGVTTSESGSTVDAAQADSVPALPEETQDATFPPADAVGLADGVGGDAAAQHEAALEDVSPASDDAGGYPLSVPCDMDASAEASVTACPPPPSACADLHRLMYFDWGQCVAGWCKWTRMTMSCPMFSVGCANGACLSGITM